MKSSVLVKFIRSIIIIVALCLGLLLSANAIAQKEFKTESIQQSLKVGIDSNFPPFTYLDNNGNALGFEVELICEILEQQGISYEFYPALWYENLKKLKDGEIDLHASVMWTEDRERELDFSTVVAWGNVFLFVREGSSIQNLSDLEKGKVLIDRDTIWDTWIVENMPHLNRMLVDTSEDALTKLSAGEADAAVMILENGLYFKRKHKLKNVHTVGEPLFQFESHYAMPEGSEKLRSKINNGLILARQSGVYDRLYDKWFGVPKPTPWISKPAIKIIGSLASVLLGGVALLVIWSRMLKNRVNQKTHELQISLDKLKQDQHVLDLIPSMIMYKDVNNRIISANKLFANSVGKKVEELKGISEYDLRPSEANHHDDDIQVIKTGLPKLNIVEAYESCGKKAWVRTDKYPIHAENRKVNGVLVIATDITDYKKTQERLEKQEYILEKAERFAQIGSWEHDFADNTVSWSLETSSIFEIDGELTNLPYNESFKRLHPEDRKRVFAEYKYALEHKDKFNTIYRLIMRDGSIKYINQIADIKYDDDSKPIRSIGIVQDVTKIKELELRTLQTQAHLAHAERLNTLGQLSSSIAHEVNQPLSSISQYCSSAKLRLNKIDINDENLLSYIDNAIQQAQRAGKIIRRLRNLVSKQLSPRAMQDMNVLITESVELLQNNLQANLVRVKLSLDDNLPMIMLDGVQIQQVIINLIRNSIDAMLSTSHKTHEIKLETSLHEGRYILVVVQDNGPGICYDANDSLFEAYVSSRKDGLGLGLSICKSIIEAHGGKIWFDRGYRDGAKINILLQK